MYINQLIVKLKEGLSPSYTTLIPCKEEKIDWSIAYESCQPDAWDDEEFNMLLFHSDGGVMYVASIDFEFITNGEAHDILLLGGKK